VPVPEQVRPVRAQEIDVLAAVDVGHPAARVRRDEPGQDTNGMELAEERRSHGQSAGRGQGATGGRDFESSLAGVDTLICRGMGRRAEEACAAMGIRVVFTAENDLDDTARKFARGELAEGEASCERGEGHGA